ncbi:glycosyltransferase family 4 protein [Novipirellula sp. SH528]|uniref:glycosyltransferase family 4 protein n=1 Tax=Novipirellula sp. SH528 TaxID=3454466 RepID=UPI003F9FC116
MNILVITNHFSPENFRVNALAFAMAKKGHQVSVLTGLPNYPEGKIFPGYGYFSRRFETVDGVKIKRIPLIPRGQGRSFNLVLNYLSSGIAFCVLAPFYCRERYDVIFVFETSPATIGLPAVILKKLHRIPIVFWVLDLWPESLSATGAVDNHVALSWVRRVVRFIYRNCSRILISSMGFEESIRKTGEFDGPIEYFPNWVEVVEPNENIDTPLPDLPEGFRIVFTGNVGVAQDFETILSAAEMARAHHDIHWIVVGDGRQLEWVRREVESRKLTDNFHLLGRHPVESMPYFLNEASALLLPLRNDPIFALTAPGKLQNYMASGRPIIAALNGEGANLVQQANAGIACGAESPERLLSAVLDLYRMSEQDRERLGRNGHDFAALNFNREQLFAKLEGILNEVVDERK